MRLVWPTVVLLVALVFVSCLDVIPVRHAAVVGLGYCSVRQFVHLPARVDVMALGSSRMRAGMSASAIDAASSGALSTNFNLGRSGLSALRSYVTLRDALERGVRPRFVVLEIDLDALQRADADARVSLPLHAAIMRWRDIGLLQELHADFPTPDRWRLWLLAAAAKLRGSIIPVLGGAPLSGLLGSQVPVADCQAGQDAQHAHRGAFEPPEPNRGTLAMEREIALAPPGARARQEELFFIGRLRALCQAHGVGLLVVRPGAIHEPVLSPAALAAVRALVPEFDEPPDSVVRKTWSGFIDASHMGPVARAQYSAWLAGRLLKASGA